MQAVQEINVAAATNLAQIQLEPLIWKIAFITNALTELHIIPTKNEKSWFANLFEVNSKLSNKIPTIGDMQKMLLMITPAKIPEDHTLHVSTPYKDLMMIKDHKYEVATSTIPVPRIRSLDENYRLKLDIGQSRKSEASDKRKSKNSIKPPAAPKKRKRKVSSEKEESEHDIELNDEMENSSSEDETTKNEAIILGSSSSEDEDFI